MRCLESSTSRNVVQITVMHVQQNGDTLLRTWKGSLWFLSGEVQENLSLFWVSQAQAAMALPAMSTARHSFDPSYG
jgi:hypothetical protein